jgi:hypothetical protein
MQHRGIEFHIRIGITAETWTWLVDIPKPKRGESRSQISAMLAAKKAIDSWCRQNPALCPPHDDARKNATLH